MTGTLKNTLEIKEAISLDLSKGTGIHWKEFQCEPQPAFNEFVVWILLFEDSELSESHKAFCDLLKGHLDDLHPLEIALFYEIVEGEEVYGVDRRVGNEAVFSNTNDLHPVDSRTRISSIEQSAYTSKNST